MPKATSDSSLRFRIFQRDGFQCVYCGRKPPACILQTDHRIPTSKGGSHTEENIVTACVECNTGKGDLLLHDEPANTDHCQMCGAPFARLNKNNVPKRFCSAKCRMKAWELEHPRAKVEELIARIDKLEAENQILRQKQKGQI